MMQPVCYDEAQCWAHAVKVYHSVMFAIAIVVLYFVGSTWMRVRNHFKQKREYESLDHIKNRLDDPYTI